MLTPYLCNAGDLRKCIAHGTPVNRCPMCLPGFMRYLGSLCAMELNKPCPPS